jgi:two-component system sensor histidine kinase and response regulator WspE
MMDRNNNDYSEKSMLELFRIEVENHCAALADTLLKLEKKPNDQELLESLMQAAHSTNGAARIVEIDPMVRITHAMEDVFVACQQGKVHLDKPDIDSLLQGVDILYAISRLPEQELAAWFLEHSDTIHTVVNTLSAILRKDSKKQTVHSQGSSIDSCPPQPTAETYQEQVDFQSLSMSDLFRIEAENHCEILSEHLLKLEHKPSSPDLLESLMRAAHCIKGAARIVELDAAIQIAHALEDIFIAGQYGTIIIDRPAIDILLQGVDLLHSIAGCTEDTLETFQLDQQTEIESLVHALQQISTPDAGNKTITAKRPSDSASVGLNTQKEKTAPPATTGTKKRADRAQDGDEQRTIRISAENISRLMGLAGEMLIESRWLPTFADRLHRLTAHHNELLLMVDKLTTDRDSRKVSKLGEERLRELRNKIEACSNLAAENNMIVEAHARHSTDISHRLYQEAIASRMVPFANGVKGFPRLVRNLARELDKKARIEIVGSKTPVDRDILEKIESPLNHLIRNALDHGIEKPAARVKSGKPPEAIIRLEALHRAGMLNIIVSDDGQGIDVETIRRKIIEKKLVTRDIAHTLSEAELIEFLFLPNFSTKDSVSKISGRGVGLDIVRNVVHEVRGVIYPSTQHNSGTKFELHLPLTLSVLRALVVEVNQEPYGLPLVNIDHIVTIPREEQQEVLDRQYIMYNDKRVYLITVRQILQLAGYYEKSDDLNVIIFNDRMNFYGLIVDRIWGIRDLVIQPLNVCLGKIKDISSASILEDGTPVLILDIEDMICSMDMLISKKRLNRIENPSPVNNIKNRKRILVADDSITVREAERKILTDKGYRVDVAVDGVDAWNTLQENTYDLIVTDVDMPRMDGIELVHMVKNDPKYEWLPIIIVSYKNREEDRHRGLDAGADYYLTKNSFENDAFTNAVQDLIGKPEV